MRDVDAAPLRIPFTAAEKSNRDRALDERLGVSVPSVELLLDAIADELDPLAGGIPWWGGLSVERRVLVADQLLVCVRGISRNLRDARIHQLEAEHAWTDFAGLFRPGGPGPDPGVIAPDTATPEEELPRIRAEVNVAGFFRAAGSALDCLAAAVVAVVSLPLKILRTDLGQVRRYLANQTASGTAVPSHRAFAREFESVVASVGPEGWLEWSLDMRNMLVHRGRRFEPVFIDVIAPQLVLPTSDRLRVDHLLPLDPGRQEMEVMKDSSSPFDAELSEHAGETLRGILESTCAFIAALAEKLSRIWNYRRANPDAWPQLLDDEWPDTTPSTATGFRGYRPGSVQVPAKGILLLSPSDAKRFESAHLL